MIKILAALALLLLPHAAWAACATTVQAKDAGGTTKTLCVVTDGGSNLVPGGAVFDAAGAQLGVAANPLQISVANTAANGTAIKVDPSAVTSPVSGTVTANQGTANATPWNDNVAQLGGNAIKTNSGNGSAGSANVYIATDQPSLTNAQPGNFTQIGGNSVSTGNGVSGTGTQRVNIASDNSALPIGASSSGATAAAVICDSHVFKHITTATDTLAVQGVTAKTIKVCGVKAQFAGTATYFLENTASTNANCGSTLTQITGVITGAANVSDGFYSAIWGGLANTNGNGLCINSTGTGGVDIDIWYTQGS